MKTEPFAKLARERCLNALRQWEADTGKHASTSEGNAFMDGWQAAQPTPEQLAQAARELVEEQERASLTLSENHIFWPS
jgi:hypothetical protein